MAIPTAPTTEGQQELVPLNAMLAAAADVQKFDVAAMHEKAGGILASIKASETLARERERRGCESM